MRPLELRLRNFRSYFGPETVFDFRDRTLVGIVGPIGAGKSSILDAISFALYGKTPTVAAATKSLIHQRAAEAAVALRFEVDGEVWEAVRMLRVKGQSQHALYLLEADEPGAEPIDRITMEAEVNAKIVTLLGLEFDAFGRSVLLAQGRFAEFLRARPAERDKVLKGVFGHERLDAMREIAKANAAVTGVELEKLGVRVEQLDRVASRLEERKGEVKVLDARLAELRTAQPQVEELEVRIRDAAASAAASEKRLAEIRELASRLPDPDTTQHLFDEASGAADKRAALGVDLEAAQKVLVKADAAVAKAEEDGVAGTIDEASRLIASAAPLERAAVDAAQRADDLATRLAGHDEQLARARSRHAAAEKAQKVASKEMEARVAGLEQIEAALVELRHANMATTLRATLHEGDTCPVCAQDVSVVPGVEPSADMAAAEEAVAEARRARDRADAVRTHAIGEVQGSQEALAGLEAERARLEAEHVAAVDGARAAEADHTAVVTLLTKLLGKGGSADLLADLKEAHAARQRSAADARKALERVRADHESAIRDQQELGKRLSALHVDLVGLVAKLDLAIEIDDDTPDALSRALVELRDAWGTVSRDLEAQQREAGEDAEVARRSRTELLEALGVDADFAAALANAAATAEVTAKAVAEDEAELAQASEVLERRDGLEAERGRFAQVASDLTDSRFVRYLLDDERTRLAALGSEHFERLSSGRYRFSEDGKFDILDLTAAEAVRKADSLSGGETFLASLALALALAEMVSRTGGRLDAFFLDEGFGSLDLEHLDLAMDGIEALVADGGGRLVVVVSHVPELRSRVEDLIVLDRDSVTGDTKVMSG